jgi:hypothetical protein
MMAILADIVWDKQTLSVVGAFGLPLICFVTYVWFHTKKVRSENALKRAMIERGMSVDEIERVMAAGPKE